MREDASLFKYELAFTIIIKNGAPYMREWIDYHRLAGVDHFYFYDNESTDNLKEVLQPYIASGVVDYTPFPGKRPQCAGFDDAVKKYRFECRYMCFIDDDEFIRPMDENKSIKDVLHEILDGNPNAVGLTLDRYDFGSNEHETADYNTPVIERFVRRGKNMILGKNIGNPRVIEFIENMHYLNYFDGKFAINPRGELNAFIQFMGQNYHRVAPVADKIFMNHYGMKSREEWQNKINRGDGFFVDNPRNMKAFDDMNKTANEVFDDGIIAYRDARAKHRGGERKYTVDVQPPVSIDDSEINTGHVAGHSAEHFCRQAA